MSKLNLLKPLLDNLSSHKLSEEKRRKFTKHFKWTEEDFKALIKDVTCFSEANKIYSACH